MKDAVVPARICRAGSQPPMAELQALKHEAQVRDRRIANSVDVSNGEMLLLRPERLRGAKVRWPKASLV